MTHTPAPLDPLGRLDAVVFEADARTLQVTYAAGGRQLVAAATGMNSPTWPVKASTAKIVVYGLPR